VGGSRTRCERKACFDTAGLETRLLGFGVIVGLGALHWRS
jgi:hypothetical protein